ncbi:MAG: hypothetical protein V1644_00790 [Candidatus Micrarchaeota archaeon]
MVEEIPIEAQRRNRDFGASTAVDVLSLHFRIEDGDLEPADYPHLVSHIAYLFSRGKHSDAHNLVDALRKKRTGQPVHLANAALRSEFIAEAKRASEDDKPDVAVRLLSAISSRGLSKVPVDDLLQMAGRSQRDFRACAKFVSFLAPHKNRLWEIGLSQDDLLGKVYAAIEQREYEAAHDLLAAVSARPRARKKLDAIHASIAAIPETSETAALRAKIGRLVSALHKTYPPSKRMR